MPESSVFEKIIARELPADIVYEDERCIAFRDIDPQAPTHLLVVPKQRINRIAEAGEADEVLIGHLFLTAARVAREADLGKGFRLVVNNGPEGGEAVPHLHIHVLGGRQMTWPPG